MGLQGILLVQKRLVDLLDVDTAILYRLGLVDNFEELAGGFLGVGKWPLYCELHAATLSSLSMPRMAIFNASSDNGRWSAFASSRGPRIQTSRLIPFSFPDLF
jgi:hypothetical protein